MVAVFGRNLRRLYTAGALFVLVALAAEVGLSVGSPTAALLTGAFVVVTIGVVWWRGFSPVLSAVTALVVAGLTAVAPLDDPALQLVLPLLCSLVVMGARPVAGLCALVGINALYIGIVALRFPGEGTSAPVVQSLSRTATAVAVVLVVRSGLRAAAAWEEQARLSRAQTRAEAEVFAMEAQARWVDHFLHDSVVHALKAVSLAGRLSRREIVAAAQETVHDLDVLVGSQTPAPLAQRLRDVAAGLDLHVRWRTEDVAVPDEVALALVDATREALRNVRLHSGTDRAEVELRRSEGGVRLSVRDRGCGFDPGAVPADHFGMRHGMQQRLARVGGRAVVTSDSRGTSVVFTWGDESATQDWTDVLGFRSLLIEAGAPFVVLNVIQAATVLDRLRHPLVAVLATMAVTVLWVGAAVHLRNRPATAHESTLLIAATVGATAVGVVSVSADFDPTTYWLAGGALPLLLFAIAARPVTRTLPWAALVAVLPTVALWWRGISPRQLADFAPALGAPAGALVLAYLAVAFVQRVVRDAAARARADDLSIGRSIRAGARRQALNARLSDLRERIAPFLSDIARTRLDPADPQVRRVARVLEARVRDVLGGDVGGWPVELMPTVDSLRVRGADVSMARHVAPDASQVASLGTVLRTLETVDVTGACIAVTVTPRLAGSLAAVTVTPYVPMLHTRLLSGLTPSVEVRTDHSSYLVVRHPDRSPSPQNVGHARSSVLADS